MPMIAVAWLSGCSPATSFDNNEQLALYIASLVPTSATVEQARATLTRHGFECPDAKAGNAVCRRKSSGLVCDQMQLAFVPAPGEAAAKLRTRLDHICL